MKGTAVLYAYIFFMFPSALSAALKTPNGKGISERVKICEKRTDSMYFGNRTRNKTGAASIYITTSTPVSIDAFSAFPGRVFLSSCVVCLSFVFNESFGNTTVWTVLKKAFICSGDRKSTRLNSSHSQ